MWSGRLVFQDGRRKQLIPALIPRTRLREGELFAEIVVDRRRPPLAHCVVQREGSAEVLFLGQFRSGPEAEWAGMDFISDYWTKQRKSSAYPAQYRRWADMESIGANGIRLRIETRGRSPVNEYRIMNGDVEFRLLDQAGRPYPGLAGEWKIMNENEIQLHHALGTVVSKWLQARLESPAAVLDQAA